MGEHLGCPRPRPVEQAYQEWQYDVLAVEYLPRPDLPADPGFFRVLERRRSSRQFGPLSRNDLAELLWHTAKTRESSALSGGRWEHRSAPSAGGRHPIDLLVSNWPAGSDALYLYDTFGHALCALRPYDRGAVERLLADAAEVMGSSDGAVLWHAAQFARTTSKYEHAESLVWRDAGAIIAVTALVAEAQGLAYCPLGITGEPHLSAALGAGQAILGVGGCMVGSRPG